MTADAQAEATADPGSIKPSRSAADEAVLRARVGEAMAAWASIDGRASDALIQDVRTVVADLIAALEAGHVRAAVPDDGASAGWRVETWVKAGILLGFRLPGMTAVRDGPILAARDKAALGALDLLDSEAARAADAAGAPWRIVAGGTSVRRGVHLEPGVTIMPPAYANIGAWVGRGSMLDSHVLVGSCAQIGRDVHLSAAVQVGGVLEPPGARPVIVEDEAFVGGGAGLYEGIIVGRRAVIGAGVIITGQSRLFDLVEQRELRGTPEAPLHVPAGAVVVPGTRPAASDWAREQGLAVAVPLIVKYRDGDTDARVALEEALR